MPVDARSGAKPLHPRFPRSVGEARSFMLERLLNAAVIDNATLERIVDRVARAQPLSAEDVAAMRGVTNLGEGILCDCDHRIHEDEVEAREITFSAV